MTTLKNVHCNPVLSSHLQRLLPGARAVCTRPPQCPDIKLYLLNEDYPQEGLDHDTLLALMEEPSYWAFCWASGQVLAAHLLDRPEIVRGKSVLDFGAGSGVAAIAAALCGARQVVACDQDPLARTACTENARLNNATVQTVQALPNNGGTFDVILVADVFYDRENLGLLDQLCSLGGRLLIADSRLRNFSPPGFRSHGPYPSHTVPDLDESQEFNQVMLYDNCTAEQS